MRNNIISVIGPTASGKTKLSIQLALHFNCEILSCDSRQLYKELNIGVAKPTISELSEVKHNFIGTHDIEKPISAAEYANQAAEFCEDYFIKKSNLILVGGSGFYADALTEGLDNYPVDPEIKNDIETHFQKYGLNFLLNEIENINSDVLKNLDIQNPRRVIRALEILKIKQNTNHFERSSEKTNFNDFKVTRFLINWKRADLYDRINSRVDLMIENGLLDEAKHLKPMCHLPSLNTVGYKELFDYLDEKCSFVTAVEKIKQHSRNYAKRQLTWLNKYQSIIHLDPYSNKPLLDQSLIQLKKSGIIIEN